MPAGISGLYNNTKGAKEAEKARMFDELAEEILEEYARFYSEVDKKSLAEKIRATCDKCCEQARSEAEWKGNGYLKHCSECGNVINFNDVSRWLYRFCPNCGAKMKGEQK